jgi:arsenate reductase-like glutaredoxin family protein
VVAGLTVYDKRACSTCRKPAEHPELVQRPIVERGDRAVLARPVERVLDLLD